MSKLAFLVLCALACIILNASGSLGAVIRPFGYEAGLAGPCGVATAAGPCALGAGYAGYGLGAGYAGYGLGAGYGLNSGCAGAYYGAGLAPCGLGAGLAGPYAAGFGSYGGFIV